MSNKVDNHEQLLRKNGNMSQALNYRHLYYFWAVCKEGGVSRAADRLGMAVQTVSAQVRELEHALGCALLRPAGRGLAMTEAGAAVLHQAEQIFQLGEQLPVLVQQALSSPRVRLSLGISDGLPKLVVRHLLDPVMSEKNLRLVCHEGQFEDLLGDLALHRLDAALADRPAPANPNLRLYSHCLGTSKVAWYSPTGHAFAARRNFPQSLATVPVLLPTHNVAIRARLDQWFEKASIKPNVVGEFEDSALLKTFAAGGMGVFPTADLVDAELMRRYKLRRVATSEGLEESFYLIVAEKKVLHPLTQRLIRSAQ